MSNVAQKNGGAGARPAAESKTKPKAEEEARIARTEAEDDGSGYSLESIGVSIGPEALDYMRECLRGRKPAIGPNLAVMGFFQKVPGAQLIGTVRAKTRTANRFNPENENVVLFIEGLCDYPADVFNSDTGEVKIKAGTYEGSFGFQLDAGTQSLDLEDIDDSTVHIKVDKRVTLPSGLKRYQYVHAYVRPSARK